MADSHQTLRCPACGKEMQKVFVPSEGVNVDICVDGCGGIFFDNREFKMFDEQSENIDAIINALENKQFEKVDDSLPRYCPACGAKMAKNFSSIKKTITVDECYSCGGKFLDHGELSAIRQEYEDDTARTADTMRFVYDEVGMKLNELYDKEPRKQSLMQKLFNKMIMG